MISFVILIVSIITIGMFAILNVVFMYGFIHLYDLIKVKFKYIVLLFIMVIILIAGVESDNSLGGIVIYNFNNSFFEAKIGYPKIFEIDESIFDEGDTVSYKVDKYANNMTKLDQLNSDITMNNKFDYQDYVLCGVESAVYSVLEKEKPIFESEHYYIFEEDKISAHSRFRLLSKYGV